MLGFVWQDFDEEGGGSLRKKNCVVFGSAFSVTMSSEDRHKIQ